MAVIAITTCLMPLLLSATQIKKMAFWTRSEPPASISPNRPWVVFMASLSRSHSWMDIWSSGFACIVLSLCSASLLLASDMRFGGMDAMRWKVYGISDTRTCFLWMSLAGMLD